jgi:hypothetical protein
MSASPTGELETDPEVMTRRFERDRSYDTQHWEASSRSPNLCCSLPPPRNVRHSAEASLDEPVRKNAPEQPIPLSSNSGERLHPDGLSIEEERFELPLSQSVLDFQWNRFRLQRDNMRDPPIGLNDQEHVELLPP